MQIEIDGRVLPQLALNDVLFAHNNPAATTRYNVIQLEPNQFKNSGLLISTGAGSSGWMYQEGGEVFDLDSKKFLVYHRGCRGQEPEVVDQIEIESKTRQGAIYIDGPHLKYDLTLGQKISIGLGEKLTILGEIISKRGDW